MLTNQGDHLRVAALFLWIIFHQPTGTPSSHSRIEGCIVHSTTVSTMTTRYTPAEVSALIDRAKEAGIHSVGDLTLDLPESDYYEEPRKSEKLLIHVNRFVIAENRENGTNKPAVTVKYPDGVDHLCHEVIVNGPSRIVYRPDEPLPIGATVWIETEAPVTEFVRADWFNNADSKEAAAAGLGYLPSPVPEDLPKFDPAHMRKMKESEATARSIHAQASALEVARSGKVNEDDQVSLEELSALWAVTLAYLKSENVPDTTITSTFSAEVDFWQKSGLITAETAMEIVLSDDYEQVVA